MTSSIDFGASTTVEGAPIEPVTESIDMKLGYFTNCEVVKLHILAGDFHGTAWPILAMPNVLKEMGKRLVATREALGMTAADLCRAIDVTQSRWSQYESGKRRITMDVALRLKQTYGISLDWIYAGDPSSLPQRIFQKLGRAA